MAGAFSEVMLVRLHASKKILKHNNWMAAFLMNKGTASNFNTKLTLNRRYIFPQNINTINRHRSATFFLHARRHDPTFSTLFKHVKLSCNILLHVCNKHFRVGYIFQISIALSFTCLFSNVAVYIVDLLCKIQS